MGRFKKYHGIKFPFTSNQDDGIFIDINKKVEDKVASEILHVILTPKGQRIRMPDFGTNLIKYIFDLSSDYTWELIKQEIKDSVSKYVPNTSLSDIEIYEDENDDNAIYADLRYSVTNGITTDDNRMVVKL